MMFAHFAFCTQVARLPGPGEAAASSTVYIKSKCAKMTGITEDESPYPLYCSCSLYPDEKGVDNAMVKYLHNSYLSHH